MRFQDYKNETRHAEDQLQLLGMAGRKIYVLRRDNHPCEKGVLPRQIETRIVVTVSAHNHNDPPALDIRLDRDGYGTATYNVLGMLSAEDLRRVADLREQVDLWISGKAECLPETMPWEKDLPPRRHW